MIFLEFFSHQLLDLKIRNSETFSAFRKSILRFIRPSSNFIFNCHSPNGTKLITTLWWLFSHLGKHKFRHNFQDTFNPICSCGDDIEATTRYLLLCPICLNVEYSWTTFKILEKTFKIKIISKS